MSRSSRSDHVQPGQHISPPRYERSGRNETLRNDDGGGSSHSPDRKRRRTEPKHRRRSASPGVSGRDPTRKPHASHQMRKKTSSSTAPDVVLPFSARPLVKSDLGTLTPLFVHYLRLQKQKDAKDMEEREFKGRWKSFAGKWNRNELAEGWYDPEMIAQILSRPPVESDDEQYRGESPTPTDSHTEVDKGGEVDEEDYGPPPPKASQQRLMGAKIPTLQDLSLRNELIEESKAEEREALRAARKADRAEQKERLEELAPRAEAGTRERKLEKRQETRDKMRQMRDKSPGAMEACNEGELIGGGDSLAEYKAMKGREQRRKSERQIRRDEFERARREEMEVKRRVWQQREEGTVKMLQELARQRFG